MAEHAHATPAGAHAHPNYVKVWAILVLLLVVSLIGPMVGLIWLTLLTAFAVAAVKAVMVAAYFMHLNIERSYVQHLLLILLALMLVLFAGVAPDVMKRAGQNWRHSIAVHVAPPAGH